MFNKNEIWAFPTDTSFGLGVRADDEAGLEKLYELKQRPEGKYFSLVVRDWEMLVEYAKVPKRTYDTDFFIERPRTAILSPTLKLPLSKYWPKDKVAFRIMTLPEIAQNIKYPITVTSANLSGQDSIFTEEALVKTFGDKIKIFKPKTPLTPRLASEIWDFTQEPAVQLR